jgi:hypothetical protein
MIPIVFDKFLKKILGINCKIIHPKILKLILFSNYYLLLSLIFINRKEERYTLHVLLKNLISVFPILQNDLLS